MTSPRVILHSSESVEWFTPPKIIEPSRRVLTRIDLDPASNDLANLIVKAKKYYTEDMDGLVQRWVDNWFCNPPYGRKVTEAWVRKGNYEAQDGQSGIMLLNATTDRSWFRTLWNYPICFLNSRIQFFETYDQWRVRFIKDWVKKKGFSPGMADVPEPKFTLLDGELVKGPSPTHGNVIVYFSKNPNLELFTREFGELGHITIPR